MKAKKVYEANFVRDQGAYKGLNIGESNIDVWRKIWDNKALGRWVFYIKKQKKDDRDKKRYIVDMIYSDGITSGERVDMIWFHETLLDGWEGQKIIEVVSSSDPKGFFDPEDVSFWRRDIEYDFIDFQENFGKRVEKEVRAWFDLRPTTGMKHMMSEWLITISHVMDTEFINILENPKEPQYYHSTETKEV